MGRRRTNEVQRERPADSSDSAFEKPHMPLVRVVQVGALIVAAVTFMMVLAAVPMASSLAFSSDGRKLLDAVNGYGWPMPRGMIKVWDAGTGKELASLAGSGPGVRAIAVSPDGSTLAVAHDTPMIELWDLRQGTLTGFLAGHIANVMAVRFSPVRCDPDLRERGWRGPFMGCREGASKAHVRCRRPRVTRPHGVSGWEDARDLSHRQHSILGHG